MSGSLSPYAYRPGHTILHRLPGTLKLLGVLAISGAAFFAGPAALGASSLLVAAGAILARIRPRELLGGSRPLMVMLLFLVIFRSLIFDPPGFSKPGCIEGLFFTWKILLSFSAGALLFSTTTMKELLDSLGLLERTLLRPLVFVLGFGRSPGIQKIRRRLLRPRLSLGISLMLGFLPRFFEVWESANLAYRARGGKGGIRQLPALIPLAAERMIGIAAETARALEARGFLP
ncbi:MAG: energy-coupling factor transporter transmembrane protein EcfT [Spirochaetaceae bacterium]|jgi:energy-coupling factor transporter transmembrane protein EcfT|nr:energy-coupling factor transporter transmembrane protein EcfT [Spirochaetaceae bacterium]